MKNKNLLVSFVIVAGIIAGWSILKLDSPSLLTLPTWIRLLFLAVCIGVTVIEWQVRLIWAYTGLFFAIMISISYIFN